MCPCDASGCCATFTGKRLMGPVAVASRMRYFLSGPVGDRTNRRKLLLYTHLHDPRLELVLEELLATRQAHPCARACMLRGAALAHAATAGNVSSIFV